MRESDRGPGDPDPAAGQSGQRGPEGEDAPADGGHRAHQGAGLLLAADELGEPDRLEGLEDHHAGRPEDLDQDQPEQHPVAAAAVAARRGPRPAPRGPTPAARRTPVTSTWVRGSWSRAATATRWTTLSAAQAEHREQQGRLRRERVPGDEATGEHGARRDRGAEHRALGGQGSVDVGAGLGDVDGVDEPRLERPGVERTEDPLQGGGEREGPERVGEDQHDAGDHVDHGRRDQHRAAAEGVGEAAGRQLEGEDHAAPGTRTPAAPSTREPLLQDPQHEQARRPGPPGTTG